MFQYASAADGALAPGAPTAGALGQEVEDIEAIARDDATLLVVGSHGRKSSCERDAGRLRIGRLAWPASGAPPAATLVARATKDEWGERLQHCNTQLIRLPPAAAASEVALRPGGLQSHRRRRTGG